MNEISPQQLLTQIRDLNAELQGSASNQVGATNQSGFGDFLNDAISSVNDSQMQAGEMKHAFEIGTPDLSLAEVMIAAQKADLSFRAMTEVRNKLVTAYQDIMNMPV